jgi:hypothetical protein
MESMEDRTMKLSGLPPFPQSLEITKCGDFTHSHRTTTKRGYTDIPIGLIPMSVLMSSNTEQVYCVGAH